jgi:hypothetical protein
MVAMDHWNETTGLWLLAAWIFAALLLGSEDSSTAGDELLEIFQ